MKPATEIAPLSDVLLIGTRSAVSVDAEMVPPAPSAAALNPLRDLYELTKPRMNFLVVATTMVGFFMAGRIEGWHWLLLIHTLIGTALTAAGASVLNQYAERDLDRLMDRTRNRPLPAGRIAPIEALLFGLAIGSCGLLILTLFVNSLTALLGAFTLGSYVLVYTPLKRMTTLCTVVGAIPGAVPPVMGVTAAAGAVTPAALVLFMVLFVWQMPHFLAIAILYKDDYRRGGFKMLPVVDPGLISTGFQMVLWSLALIPVALTAVMFGIAGPAYFAAAFLMSLAFVGFAVLCAVRRTRSDARQLFLASIVYLPCLLAAMMMG